MRPIRVFYTPAATTQNGFANNITGASWTLTTLTPADGLGHFVTIHNDSGTDHSLKTLVLSGLDQDGKSQTETVNLPTGTATVTSTKYFSTLISPLVPSATIGADTMDIGWSAVAVSPTIPLDWRQDPFNVTLVVDVSGTISVTAQHTADNPYDYYDNHGTLTVGSQTALYFDDATIASKSADTQASLITPYQATRLKVNSVTATATVAYTILSATEF